MTPKLYKVLIETTQGVRSLYTDFTDYLPRGGEVGPWLPWIDNPQVYSEGYHLTDTPTRHGLPGDVVFEAEGMGFGGSVKDEYTYSTIRLIKKIDCFPCSLFGPSNHETLHTR
jgi:hypothetical protein